MSNDQFGIDDSKIAYHPERVNQWLDARGDIRKQLMVYPIYIEISPMGGCNHRCIFCSVDYLGYDNSNSLIVEILKNRLDEMGKKGVKSIMYAGEGEPLMHKNLASIIQHTKKEAGIDVAITTNATPLTEKFAFETLPFITWIKASINAGTAKDYAMIHRAPEKHFEKVWKNMERAVEIRTELGLEPDEHTLGAQMVLLPENSKNAVDFVKRARDSGLDYAVIKPYSQHKKSYNREHEGLRYGEFLSMEEELKALNTDKFQVIFRKKTMERLDNSHEEDYAVCPSTPFMWGYIMANGDVYGCSAYLKDDRFLYGNIHDQTFVEIWEGEKRRKAIDFVQNELDITHCRENCRMRQVNRFLENFKNGKGGPNLVNFKGTQKHINFI